MPARKRREPVGGQADCQLLTEITDAYQPIITWSRSERFFPVLAEAWLQLASGAAWTPEEADAEGLPVDPRRRGTALCQGDPDTGKVHRVGGAPNPADRPLQFSDDNSDTDAIGARDWTTVGPETFLSVGGWVEAYRKGDVDYLATVFSELAAAINPTVEWNLKERLANAPVAWTPQPVSPTAYVEAEWGGTFAGWNDGTDLNDFPREVGHQLRKKLFCTYHYLYASKEPPPGADGPRQEGQWEAVTLVFDGEGDTVADGEVLFRVIEPPTHVIISKGLDPATRAHRSEVRPYSAVQRDGDQPIVYVAAGTHHHYFDRSDPGVGASPVGAPPPRPDDGLASEGTGEFPGQEGLLFLAVAAASLIPGPVGWVLALFFLLLWLISVIWDAINQGSGDPVPDRLPNDEAQGNGPVAGGGEPPVGSPATGAPPGTTNVGSADGSDIVAFDLRLVDSLHRRNKPSPYPPDDRCEYPTWWSYSGLWGVNVAHSTSSGWEGGMSRVDKHHRGWGYWHAHRLITYLNGGPAGP